MSKATIEYTPSTIGVGLVAAAALYFVIKKIVQM